MNKLLLSAVTLLMLCASALAASSNIKAVTCEGEVGSAHTLIVGNCSFTGPQAGQVWAKCKEDILCRVQAYGWDNGQGIFIISRVESVQLLPQPGVDAHLTEAEDGVQAKPLPPCDDSEVQKVLARSVNIYRDFSDVSEMGSEPDTNTKRMCYVYFFGQTGKISSAYQEAVFSLEWINEAEGRWWLQIRTRQAIYKGPTKAETKQRHGE
jgi:hypothetical protein